MKLLEGRVIVALRAATGLAGLGGLQASQDEQQRCGEGPARWADMQRRSQTA